MMLQQQHNTTPIFRYHRIIKASFIVCAPLGTEYERFRPWFDRSLFHKMTRVFFRLMYPATLTLSSVVREWSNKEKKEWALNSTLHFASVFDSNGFGQLEIEKKLSFIQARLASINQRAERCMKEWIPCKQAFIWSHQPPNADHNEPTVDHMVSSIYGT